MPETATSNLFLYSTAAKCKTDATTRFAFSTEVTFGTINSSRSLLKLTNVRVSVLEASLLEVSVFDTSRFDASKFKSRYKYRFLILYLDVADVPVQVESTKFTYFSTVPSYGTSTSITGSTVPELVLGVPVPV